MIANYVAWVKEKYEQKKKEFKLAKKILMEIKYLEKYQWLEKYMDHLEVFHINQLHRHIVKMKDDMGDYKEETPTRTTLSDHLHKMYLQRNQFGNNLLGFKVLPSNKPEPYKVYWLPGTHKDKIKEKIQSIVSSYKEPKHKKSKRIAREEEIPDSVQSKLDHYRRKIIEEKMLSPVKKELQEEKNKQSAWNQKDYLKKQRELVKEFQEESSTEEIFDKALKKQTQKKADTIVKNVLDEQQRELTTKQRIGQNTAIIEEMENLKIVVPESIKKRPEKLQKIASSKGKKKPKLKITEKSFVDSSNYQEVVEERVEGET